MHFSALMRNPYRFTLWQLTEMSDWYSQSILSIEPNTSLIFGPTMSCIRTNLIPLFFFLFGFVITRTYYATDANDKIVFQFPEYDYKETNKNVSRARQANRLSLIDFSKELVKWNRLLFNF